MQSELLGDAEVVLEVTRGVAIVNRVEQDWQHGVGRFVDSAKQKAGEFVSAAAGAVRHGGLGAVKEVLSIRASEVKAEGREPTMVPAELEFVLTLDQGVALGDHEGIVVLSAIRHFAVLNAVGVETGEATEVDPGQCIGFSRHSGDAEFGGKSALGRVVPALTRGRVTKRGVH